MQEKYEQCMRAYGCSPEIETSVSAGSVRPGYAIRSSVHGPYRMSMQTVGPGCRTFGSASCPVAYTSRPSFGVSPKLRGPSSRSQDSSGVPVQKGHYVQTFQERLQR
jgi:hypothetical protein